MTLFKDRFVTWDNDAPFSCGAVLWQRKPSEFMATLVVKTTYALGPEVALLVDEPEPVLTADDHWDDDDQRSLRFPSDLAPFKSTFDVVLVGNAYALQPVERVIVRVVAGTVDKCVEARVPTRITHDGQVEPGRPASRMSLRYELCPHCEENPVGIDPTAWDEGAQRYRVPQVLPSNLALQPGAPIAFTGVGPIAPRWPTRARLLRPDDYAWLERPRALPRPSGFDARHFSIAPEDQRSSVPFQPDERIIIENLSRQHGRLVTNLPGVVPTLRASFDIPRLSADTLLIDSDRGLATLTWRTITKVDPNRPIRVGVSQKSDRLSLAPGYGESTMQLDFPVDENTFDADSAPLPFPASIPRPRPSHSNAADGALPFRHTSPEMMSPLASPRAGPAVSSGSVSPPPSVYDLERTETPAAGVVVSSSKSQAPPAPPLRGEARFAPPEPVSPASEVSKPAVVAPAMVSTGASADRPSAGPPPLPGLARPPALAEGLGLSASGASGQPPASGMVAPAAKSSLGVSLSGPPSPPSLSSLSVPSPPSLVMGGSASPSLSAAPAVSAPLVPPAPFSSSGLPSSPAAPPPLVPAAVVGVPPVLAGGSTVGTGLGAMSSPFSSQPVSSQPGAAQGGSGRGPVAGGRTVGEQHAVNESLRPSALATPPTLAKLDVPSAPVSKDPFQAAFSPSKAPAGGASVAKLASDAATAPRESSKERIESDATGGVLRRYLIDLLAWSDDVPRRLRRSKSYAALIADFSPPRAFRRVDEADGDKEKEKEERARLEVLRVLSCGEATDVGRISAAVDAALEDPNDLEMPLFLVSGDLKPTFDEVESLKAAVKVAQPLGASDKRVVATLNVITEALGGSTPPTTDTALSLLRQLEQSVQGLNLPSKFLSESVERSLLETRAYKKRLILGETRIRCELSVAGGAPWPAYVSESAGPDLPMLISFPIVSLAEVRPKEDAFESHSEALVLAALGRVIRKVRR